MGVARYNTRMENSTEQEELARRKAISQSWRVIRLDETRQWSLEHKKQGITKITRAYLYNTALAAHLCELTPSYELEPIETSQAEIDYDVGNWRAGGKTEEEYRESIEQYLLAPAEDYEPIYMHTRTVDRLESVPVAWDFDPDMTEEEEREAVREYVQANSKV